MKGVTVKRTSTVRYTIDCPNTASSLADALRQLPPSVRLTDITFDSETGWDTRVRLVDRLHAVFVVEKEI